VCSLRPLGSIHEEIGPVQARPGTRPALQTQIGITGVIPPILDANGRPSRHISVLINKPKVAVLDPGRQLAGKKVGEYESVTRHNLTT
jgi:hypothetical protein